MIIIISGPHDDVPSEQGTLERMRVEINGIGQGMIVEGTDPDKPVLLFLHGGPGMPEYFLNKRYPTGLDDMFTVCWWEMRGAGLSYDPKMSRELMTTEQMIVDTIEVARFLQDRFKKPKIYLMAHSGGTFFGIQAAARRPDLFHAYIGIGQMAYQLRSEMLAYEHMVKSFEERGNDRMARRLRQTPLEMKMPLPEQYLAVRDRAMHGLGIGTMHDMRSVLTGIFMEVWLSPYYSLREKRAIWKGKRSSQDALWDEMFTTDLTKKIGKLDIPTYFCSGVHDFTVSYELARSFLYSIQAPVKGFYSFERSVHSPLFEEPMKMCQIMREDVLWGTDALADRHT